MRPQHILLTTDLSTEASRAFDPVASLARQNGARITLLHVVPELAVAPHGEALDASTPRVAHKIQEALPLVEEQARALGNEVPVQVEVIPGEDAAKCIAEFAREHGVDLIAISTHGRSGLRKLVLGSIASGVLKHASVPVLCFPPD